MMDSMNGWHGQLYRVDLSGHSFKREDIPHYVLERYLGGRGLGAKYLKDEVHPSTDPFDKGNKIIYATGPITGTSIPTSGRFSVTSKSPLTGTIFDCNAGGTFGPALKSCGIDAVILEGKAPEPLFLKITPDAVEFHDAVDAWGKTIPGTTRYLKEHHGKKVKVSCIGPAGENRVMFANIMNDYHHALGRGGLGAIMGSKQLKAIMVDAGERDQRKQAGVADPDMLKVVIKEINKRINASPVTGKGMRLFGTAQLVNLINSMGLFPIRNFQSATDPRADNLSGETIREEIMVSKTACYACSIACGRMTRTSTGREGKGPEYESDWALGADCGIFDLEAVTEANYDCNEMGLDTISCGATIACAMELNQDGRLPDEWSEIRFGNANALQEAIHKIVSKTGIGADLAMGSRRLASKFGAPGVAMQVKGLEIPAYDPRGAFGMALAYATSNRGACHLRAYTVGAELLGLPKMFNRFSFSDKPDLVVTLQNMNAFFDSLVACKFTGMGVPDDYYARALSAVLGSEVSVTDAEIIGERVYNLERHYNAMIGFTREDDTLPPRFSEPLVEGPSAGKIPPLALMLDMYYGIRNWDVHGIPTTEKLKELGISAGEI
ncbi:aldehyde ferredoxin oxidoreductase [Candidatus Bathyarchaeota archaeon]|nr:aldehyde ferredoxin oxidoreductase [Candidatus Bathyarchaeota archaeon]